MKLFTVLSVAAALCGYAVAAPALPGAETLTKRYNHCGRHPDFDWCEPWNNKYVVCIAGKATFYTCDGGCQPQCPIGVPCTARCDNGKLSGPPDPNKWEPAVHST
ncbi:uncharacterized protein GIQ15_01809 [Arthroderma uncinatum]|uniref:uncharacterized protein n=1 Tax=Arthroderma uncinatum TaxID=74035 RepID=UPI00144A9182|nr:uncharacterized protein GIQ15_01809 [Arthroderma uncinatum]KAF3492292.1 hypothetical protein GIQ15_01809 [Arthroderma uncinatum]